MRAALLSLHARLILDSRQPFITHSTTQNSADIETTPDGKAWLDDYGKYLDLWTQLASHGTNPELLLHERFGYAMSDDTALERSRKSPSGVRYKARLARKRRRR